MMHPLYCLDIWYEQVMEVDLFEDRMTVTAIYAFFFPLQTPNHCSESEDACFQEQLYYLL